MGNLYTSFAQFEKAYENEVKKIKSKEKNALVFYFRKGGLVKTKYTPQLRITYPSKQKVKEELVNLSARRAETMIKLKEWGKIKYDADNYLKKTKRKRFFDSLYWKHKMKSLTDKDYREEIKKLKIPMDLMADPKLKKILHAFMTNQTYRETVIDTVENSVVYRDKGFGEQILQAIEIKKGISEKKITLFSEVLQGIDNLILGYKVINRWVSVNKD